MRATFTSSTLLESMCNGKPCPEPRTLCGPCDFQNEWRSIINERRCLLYSFEIYRKRKEREMERTRARTAWLYCSHLHAHPHIVTTTVATLGEASFASTLRRTLPLNRRTLSKFAKLPSSPSHRRQCEWIFKRLLCRESVPRNVARADIEKRKIDRERETVKGVRLHACSFVPSYECVRSVPVITG